MTDVFLTGGSGFVGGALLRTLTDQGRDVRALVRTDRAAAIVADLGAQPIRGDLDDRGALIAGMRGCAVVFNAAGVNAMCLRDPEPMVRTNVEGAATVVRAAAAAGVPRVVHTSSAATIGEAAGTVGREDSPHRGSFLSAYERSKFLAEREVFSRGRTLGVHVVCVNPSSVQGPGRTSGTAKLLLASVNGRLPFLVDSTLSVVDVQDCTRAHLLAEERGAPGARYLVNTASLTTREAVTLLRQVWGRPRRVAFVPRVVARASGAMAGTAGRVRRTDRSLCPEMVRTLLHGHRYDGSTAARELGLRYTPLEESIRRTLAWYAARGMVAGPLLDGAPPIETDA